MFLFQSSPAVLQCNHSFKLHRTRRLCKERRNMFKRRQDTLIQSFVMGSYQHYIHTYLYIFLEKTFKCTLTIKTDHTYHPQLHLHQTVNKTDEVYSLYNNLRNSPNCTHARNNMQMQILLDHDLLFEAMQQTHNDNEAKHRNHEKYKVAPMQLIKMA